RARGKISERGWPGRIPHLAKGWWLWIEPYRRQLRGAFRPVVEPRRRKPGHRPHPPHRPDEQGHCLPAPDKKQHRGKNPRAAETEEGPGGGRAGRSQVRPKPHPGRPALLVCRVVSLLYTGAAPL